MITDKETKKIVRFFLRKDDSKPKNEAKTSLQKPPIPPKTSFFSPDR